MIILNFQKEKIMKNKTPYIVGLFFYISLLVTLIKMITVDGMGILAIQLVGTPICLLLGILTVVLSKKKTSKGEAVLFYSSLILLIPCMILFIQVITLI